MKIISIQGPQAVGKSTLISNLQQEFKRGVLQGVQVEEKKPFNFPDQYNLENPEEFLKNQRIYFANELKRWEMLKNFKCYGVILDRGPEDTICFSYIFPRFLRAEWNIDAHIPALTKRYIKNTSHRIIYLTASYESIQARKLLDTTRDRNYCISSSEYWKLEKDYFASLDKTIIIDTTNCSQLEVTNICLDVLHDALKQG